MAATPAPSQGPRPAGLNSLIEITDPEDGGTVTGPNVTVSGNTSELVTHTATWSAGGASQDFSAAPGAGTFAIPCGPLAAGTSELVVCAGDVCSVVHTVTVNLPPDC